MRNRKKRLWFKRQAELEKQQEAQVVAPEPVVEEPPPAPVVESQPEAKSIESEKPQPKPKKRRRRTTKKSAE
jgi:hypothetical protein